VTNIIAMLLVLGQFEAAVETSRGYFVAAYPDTEAGVTQFLREIRAALETESDRFYPCVVYNGPVRDLFESPLARRIGLEESLRTGQRAPGSGHHGPSLVRSDGIKTYLAHHPTDKLDAKIAEKICLAAFPPNHRQLYSEGDSREFYQRSEAIK